MHDSDHDDDEIALDPDSIVLEGGDLFDLRAFLDDVRQDVIRRIARDQQR